MSEPRPHEALIDRLGTELVPVRRLLPPWLRTAGWLLVVAVIAAVLLGHYGVHGMLQRWNAAPDLAWAGIGAVLERTLYRHLYGRSHLDQVLFSIGLVFMAVAVVDYVIGSDQQLINLPPMLSGRLHVAGIGIGVYRLFLIVVCALLMVLLQLALTRTRFGSRLRAAVDDPRVARGLGINVGMIFAVTFAVGSGLAGLGGALGADLLGIDPTFPLKYMIYFLIVVTVGGTSSITGPFLASLLLGIGDIAGKYYVPTLGSFVIYTIMIVVLIWRPQGLFARAASR